MTAARSFFVIAAALLLSACGDDDAESPAPAASAPPTPAATTPAPPQTSDPELARAVSAGKPAAGVDLHYEITSRPEVGVPVDIELVFTSSVEIDKLDASLSGMDGLRVTSAESEFTAGSLAAGDELRRTVTVVSEAPGIYYLSAVVKTDGATGVQARTFAIPLVAGQVEAAQKASAGPTEIDADGEPIKSLPADESGS